MHSKAGVINISSACSILSLVPCVFFKHTVYKMECNLFSLLGGFWIVVRMQSSWGVTGKICALGRNPSGPSLPLEDTTAMEGGAAEPCYHWDTMPINSAIFAPKQYHHNSSLSATPVSCPEYHPSPSVTLTLITGAPFNSAPRAHAPVIHH